MKILIVSQYFWPESFRINDLAVSLKSRGHDVSVLTGLPNYPSGYLFQGYSCKSCGKSDYQGVKVFRVPLFCRRQGKSWQLVINYLSFVFSSCLLGPIMCRDKYDLIFVMGLSPFTVGIPGVLFRFLKNAPMILWVQDLWPESLSATGAVKSQFIINWVGKMVKFIYKRCDRILIQSRSFAEPAILAGAESKKITYFPNWAEEFYKPISLEKSKFLNKELPKGFCLMFAGNLGEAQSLDTIVKVAQKLRNIKNIHWIFIGGGRREKWLQDKIAELKLEEHIHMLGRRAPEEMPYYFSLADVLLVTLRREPIFALTIPSKIQSYLACGKPILGALDGEGAKVINESGCGYAVPADDSDSLAEFVLRLYEMNDEKRQMMGKSGKIYYDKYFDRSCLFEQLENLILETTKDELCES